MSHITPIFAIGPAAYASLQGRRYLGRALAILVIPVIVCLGIAFVRGDLRWVIVAFALLTIAYPAVATMAWLALMANPQAALRCRPQQWSFADNGDAEIKYYVPGTCGDDETPAVADGTMLRLSDVKGFEWRAKNAVFYTSDSQKAKPENIFIIPASFLPVGLADKIYSQLDE